MTDTRNNPSIPRGIEVLVKKAAVDPQFRATLLAKRAAAAAEIGLGLTPAETMMLNAVPAAQLQAIIGQTRVDPAIRPAFLGKVAAAMLMALGVTTFVAGCPAESKGHQADVPPPKPDTKQAGEFAGADGDAVAQADPNLPRVVLGIQPLNPPPAPSPSAAPLLSKGIQPDRPPATQPVPQGIRPDRPATQPAVSVEQIDAIIAKLDQKTHADREAAERELRTLDMTAATARLREKLAAGKLSAEAADRAQGLLSLADEIPLLVRKLEFQIVARRGATLRHDTTPDEAEARLIEIGPWVLPAVRQALAGGKLPADAKLRSERIVAKLEPAATSQPSGPLSRGIRPDRPPTTQSTIVPEPQPMPEVRFGVRPDGPIRVAGIMVEPAPVDEPREMAGARAIRPIAPIAGDRVDGPQPPGIAGIAPGPRPPATQPTTQPTSQPTAVSPAEFDALVKQLDDPKFPVREAAEQRLTQAGREILPRLQQAQASADLPPEAAWRIKRIIDKLNPPAAGNPPPDRPRVAIGIVIEREVIDGLRADPPPR